MRRTPRPVTEHDRAVIRGFEATLQRGKGAFSERAFDAAPRHRELPTPATVTRWLERHGALPEQPDVLIIDDPVREGTSPNPDMVERAQHWYADQVLMRQPGRLTGRYPQEYP